MCWFCKFSVLLLVTRFFTGILVGGGGVNDATNVVTGFSIYIQYVNNQIICIAYILHIKLNCLPPSVSFLVAENGTCDVRNVVYFILYRS